MSDKISEQSRPNSDLASARFIVDIDLSDFPAVRESEYPYNPTADQLERLKKVSEILEEAPAEVILRWAIDTFYPKLTMATAFGPEGCVILSILARLQPNVRVFNLDTGYQFRETLELRDRIAAKYG
ncbi:MAG TPA: phosphoadenosine phosphosulfate reductase family protein, partial [Thermogutta sp.]|nr:phosphoadenosine phosphosulfate reductase family protein [Thermogutta sp.]